VEGEVTHRLVNPPGLAPPVGFSHAVVAAEGRTVYLGGQAGHDPEGRIVDGGLEAQFDRACANVVAALQACGGAPEHLVQVQIFTLDAAAYRRAAGELGAIWRRHFGRHYPALALFEVTGLFDADAIVELVATAVLP
jgi:enamine deaminase RidA (YjgF/YER057c/UK114 family)